MKILFCGSKALGLSVLSRLVSVSNGESIAVCHPMDQGDSRSVVTSFSQFCRENNIPLSVTADDDSLRNLIINWKPDLVVVCGWYKIITPEVLSLVPRGFVGIHNSLLPNYRGGSPLVWAMINGEAVVGSTLFLLSEGVDDGPILHQISASVEGLEQIGSVLKRLEKKICDEFPSKIMEYALAPWELQEQLGLGTTYPIRKPQDGKIDFSLSVREVCNFIHAQSRPYPGAFATVSGKTVRIWRACPADSELSICTSPGRNSHHKPETLKFSCADGSILTCDWEVP